MILMASRFFQASKTDENFGIQFYYNEISCLLQFICTQMPVNLSACSHFEFIFNISISCFIKSFVDAEEKKFPYSSLQQQANYLIHWKKIQKNIK